MKLEIKELSITMREGQFVKEILAIDHFVHESGRSLGIAGPSGAGKTTLLQVLGGLLPLQKGSVKWGDSDLCSFSEKEKDLFRQSHVGYLFQFPKLFNNLSAKDNLLLLNGFCKKKITPEQVDTVFDDLGLSCAERPVKFLSGGEKQRVSLARAIIHQPDILLADEPTASLDKENRKQVIELLQKTVSGSRMTLIIVSHDQEILDSVDDTITLINGRPQ